MPQVFYSDNDTDTLADALKAVGLAEMLRGWLRALDRDASAITVRDCGGYYKITLPSALELADIAVTAPFDLEKVKTLDSANQIEKAQKSGKTRTGFDYITERANSAAYFERLKKMTSADRKRFANQPDDPEFVGIQPPHPELPLYVCINHFKVADGYNALCERWQGTTSTGFRYNLELALAIFGQHPNATEQASNRWDMLAKTNAVKGKGAVTLLQVVNPGCGKGGNAVKANSLGIGNLDGFWLLEFLKFAGYFSIAAPVMIKGVKDRKTYVLQPHLIELNALNTLMASFRGTFYSSTPVKADILAALRFTQTFVDYCGQAIRERTADHPLFALFGQQRPTVTDISTGFAVAFYKDMGSAYATMNLATINLPDWLDPVTKSGDAEQQRLVLDEHIQVIRSIQTTKGEEGTEELELLRRYRDFLSGHDILRFFDFAATFGDYYLAHRHRNQWVGQFTTTGMENLMTHTTTATKLAPILATDGFKAIAEAIRRSTVLAQYHAAREGGFPYDVRYGLGQDLLRAAAYPEDFIAALGAFLQSYNAENARIDERITKGSLRNEPRFRRSSVRTSHIDDIVGLIDNHGSEVVCKMLVAYGYARDPKTQQPEITPAGIDEVTEATTGK